VHATGCETLTDLRLAGDLIPQLRQKQHHSHAIGTGRENFSCHTKAQDPTAPTREKAKRAIRNTEKFQWNHQAFGKTSMESTSIWKYVEWMLRFNR
jgi:hypothetical protein